MPLAEMDVTPLVQAGFAGFAFVLLAFLAWCVKQQFGLQRDTNAIIAANTAAIDKLHTTADESGATQKEIRDLLMTRPCIARGER